jgi:hypothetical protein
MSIGSIQESFKSTKTKNVERYDRIPQRILKDGSEYLITTYFTLMNKMYQQKQYQWGISKIFPVHKKKPITECKVNEKLLL